MGKLYITEEIANHEANKHFGLVVGEVEVSKDDLCGGKKMPLNPDGNGHWSCVLNEWVWVPAP